MEVTRCICGKRTKMKQNGQPGKTCGSHSCSGKLSKAHMLEVMKTGPNYLAISFASRDFKPFHRENG
jgi:hypothetical protein